jgi:hypothetical protein
MPPAALPEHAAAATSTAPIRTETTPMHFKYPHPMGAASSRYRYRHDVPKRARRIVWGVGALLAGALIAGIAALFAFGSHGGSAVTPTQVQANASTSTPPPPAGAVVLAGELGSRPVALAVKGNSLTASVLAPSGDPESGLKLAFRIGGRSLPGRPCGPGCYRATATRAPRQVAIALPDGRASFRIPAATRPGTEVVARAGRVFRGLRSLVYVESLRSGPTGGLLTTWRMAAPDRLSYQIRNGAAAVVIASRRWDQARPGAKWVESQSTRLDVPAPTWGAGVTNAHIVGSGTVRGRPVWLVSFATPSVPAWFTAWIDKRSYRTLQLRMTAASHFMFHRYTEFNAPLRIKPPT